MKVPFRYMLTAFGIALTSFLIAAGTTLYFWFGAVWAVLLFVAPLLPILLYASIGGLIFDPRKTSDGLVDDDAPLVSERVKALTIPIIVSAIPFGLALASWHDPLTRAGVTAAAGAVEVRPIVERGLADRSEVVSRAGCLALDRMGANLSDDLVIAKLFEAQDEALVECLLKVLPSESEGPLNIRLEMLAARWERELSQEALEPERACSLADHLRHSDRAGATLASARLLVCAIAAPTQGAQSCCLQSLRSVMSGAPSVASILPPAERAIESSSIFSRAEVFLEADESATPETVATLGLDQPEFRAWSYAVGCAAIANRSNDVRDTVGKTMARELASHEGCTWAPPDESTVGIWNQACGEATAELNPAGVGGAICDGLGSRFLLEATAVLRSDVRRAQRTAEKEATVTAPSIYSTMMELLGTDPDYAAITASDPKAAQQFQLLKRLGVLDGANRKGVDMDKLSRKLIHEINHRNTFPPLNDPGPSD